MSSNIEEGVAPMVGSSAGSPADQLIPPTGEVEIAVPEDNTAAAIPEGETISIVSTSIVCQESVKLTIDPGLMGRGF
jgi:hypothetical protein